MPSQLGACLSFTANSTSVIIHVLFTRRPGRCSPWSDRIEARLSDVFHFTKLTYSHSGEKDQDRRISQLEVSRNMRNIAYLDIFP
jgi:hypothetical protein